MNIRLRLPAAGIAFAVLVTAASADVLNVPGDYATIQDAIDAAGKGDEVVVAEGEYFENLEISGKPSITLRSTDPAKPAVVTGTIINGGGKDSVIRLQSSSVVIRGFVITNGNGDGAGGGIYSTTSDLVLSQCTIHGNTAGPYNSFGGGIANSRCTTSITNCTFSSNTGQLGAGVFNFSGDVSVSDCLFLGNVGVLGGGMTNEGSNATVLRCIFRANSAERGGGMSTNGGAPTIINCTFEDNTAFTGAAVSTEYSSTPSFESCRFSRNIATLVGGAIRHESGGVSTVTGSTFCANVPDQIDGDYVDGGENTMYDRFCPPPPPPAGPCPGDADGDGVLGFGDVLHILANWGQICP